MGVSLDGKVALVTGAARGQGRTTALQLAEAGADVVVLDICAEIGSVPYGLATTDDLEQTVVALQEHGGRVHSAVADVRSQNQLDAVVGDALQLFGGIDIVCANAGVYAGIAESWMLSEMSWRDTLDVNVTGTWHTVKAVAPSMIEAGRGGSIVITGSTAGLGGAPLFSHYAASKHALQGLMKCLAIELAPHGIRVNTVNPTTVRTAMGVNDVAMAFIAPGLEQPSPEDESIQAASRAMHPLGTPWVEPEDVSRAAVWLASDEARFVTGVALPVDAGFLL